MVVRSLSLSPSILFASILVLVFLIGTVSATCQGCTPPTLVIRVRIHLLASTFSVTDLPSHVHNSSPYNCIRICFLRFNCYRKTKLRNAHLSGSCPLSKRRLLRTSPHLCAKFLR